MNGRRESGGAQIVAVTRSPFGNVATSYRGTGHFTSSDAHALLPATLQHLQPVREDEEEEEEQLLIEK